MEAEDINKIIEQREKELANHKANMKKYREKPEVKAKHKEYMRE